MGAYPIIPKECDICHDKLGLYQPWYSVQARGHLASTKTLKYNPTVLCPDCFQAYKNFLVEQEVQENHKKNRIDIKHEEE